MCPAEGLRVGGLGRLLNDAGDAIDIRIYTCKFKQQLHKTASKNNLEFFHNYNFDTVA